MANYAAKPWLDPRRGDIPLAWGMNPALVEDIPAIMTYLYATQTGSDYFVAANSGAGYLNPDALSELTLVRWLWRSRQFYTAYGYNVQGFLLNGNGAAMSQRRLDSFTWLAPAGIITPDFEIDEPWPRLQWGTPAVGDGLGDVGWNARRSRRSRPLGLPAHGAGRRAASLFGVSLVLSITDFFVGRARPHPGSRCRGSDFGRRRHSLAPQLYGGRPVHIFLFAGAMVGINGRQRLDTNCEKAIICAIKHLG